jgi:hypothetical protein
MFNLSAGLLLPSFTDVIYGIIMIIIFYILIIILFISYDSKTLIGKEISLSGIKRESSNDYVSED